MCANSRRPRTHPHAAEPTFKPNEWNTANWARAANYTLRSTASRNATRAHSHNHHATKSISASVFSNTALLLHIYGNTVFNIFFFSFAGSLKAFIILLLLYMKSIERFYFGVCIHLPVALSMSTSTASLDLAARLIRLRWYSGRYICPTSLLFVRISSYSSE